MFIKRFASAVVLIAIILLAIWVTWLFNIAIMAFIILGLYEYFTMLEKKGIQIYKYVGIGIGAMIPLSIIWRFELTKRWEFLFIVLMLLFPILMVIDVASSVIPESNLPARLTWSFNSSGSLT